MLIFQFFFIFLRFQLVSPSARSRVHLVFISLNNEEKKLHRQRKLFSHRPRYFVLLCLPRSQLISVHVQLLLLLWMFLFRDLIGEQIFHIPVTLSHHWRCFSLFINFHLHSTEHSRENTTANIHTPKLWQFNLLKK